MSTLFKRTGVISFATFAGLAVFSGVALADPDGGYPSAGEYRTEERGPEPMSCSDALELAKYKQKIASEDSESAPNESLVPTPKECERDIVTVMNG